MAIKAREIETYLAGKHINFFGDKIAFQIFLATLHTRCALIDSHKLNLRVIRGQTGGKGPITRSHIKHGRTSFKPVAQQKIMMLGIRNLHLQIEMVFHKGFEFGRVHVQIVADTFWGEK